MVDTQIYTPSLGMTRADAQAVASQTTAYEVIYSRILPYTPPPSRVRPKRRRLLSSQ